MCWPPLSPTSWLASHGACLHKTAHTRRASAQERHEMSSLWVHQWDGAPLHHPRSPDWASERRWLRWDGVSGSFAHEVEGDTCRGLRVGFEDGRTVSPLHP